MPSRAAAPAVLHGKKARPQGARRVSDILRQRAGEEGRAGHLVRATADEQDEVKDVEMTSGSESSSITSSDDSSSEGDSPSDSDVGDAVMGDGFDGLLNEVGRAAAEQLSLETRNAVETGNDRAAAKAKKSVAVLDKDEEEAELEALVFGDSAGFRDSVAQLSKQEMKQQRQAWRFDADDANEEEEEEHGDDPEALGDDDLFFVDAVGDAAMGDAFHDEAARGMVIASGEQESMDGEGAAAWEDSDDARIRVSLAQAPRLRKLRVTEDEDLVSGKEYIRRLRRQYLKLNPRPQWVDDAVQMQRRRKRRRTGDGASGSDSSDSDTGMHDGDAITGHRSLADLLRDATSLVQPGKSPGKRKFRPEVIDIQRTKHIADSGPSAITTLQVHPQLPLLIASGPSSKLDLYHLHDNAPAYTSHLTSLWMKRHPFTTTLFHPLHTDPRIFLSARRRYFHVWNLSSGSMETVTRMYGHAHEQRTMENFKIDPTGRFIAFVGSAKKGGGVLNFIDANTLQWTAQARIEGRGGIADFCWWRDGSGVVVASKAGEMTEWSLVHRRVVAQWRDEGGVGTTTIALGGRSKLAAIVGGDAYIAVGSQAGIVNVYSRSQWLSTSASTSASTSTELATETAAPDADASSAQTNDTNDTSTNSSIPRNPKPLRALDQLTTPISHLAFTPNGQVLCMASRWKKDALRLVHLPSCAVYRNWPTANTPLGRISAVCWGEIVVGGGGAGEDAEATRSVLKLIVGNEAGRVAAWDVRGN